MFQRGFGYESRGRYQNVPGRARVADLGLQSLGNQRRFCDRVACLERGFGKGRQEEARRQAPLPACSRSPMGTCTVFSRDQNSGLVPQHSGDPNLSLNRTT